MDINETLTPIEYRRDGWHDREDVTIWHCDMVVDNIIYYDVASAYNRIGYHACYRFEIDERPVHIDDYSCCLRVEPNSNEYYREQIYNMVGVADNDLLLETLMQLRQCIDRQKTNGDKR